MDQKQRPKEKKSRDSDWSEMCFDALQLILESLSFADFHRARTVCSNWYSVSKSCIAGSRNRHPWLILYPDRGSFKLFNPEEDKTYKTIDLGDKRTGSRCIATCGNWLLVLTPLLDFSILNVFSGEEINLPCLSLQLGKVRFRRKTDGGFFLQHSPTDRETIINRFIKTAVLWIDEKTKDYVVCWIYNNQDLFSYKKGDESWWHHESTRCCYSLAYKNNKLYVLTCSSTSSWNIKILDFSNDFPFEIIEENPYLNLPFKYYSQRHESWREKVAVTTSGDVLIVLGIYKKFLGNQEKGKYFFNVFKMNVEGTGWERVDDSLGDEIVVCGDGFIKSDSIYFVTADVWNFPTIQISTGVYDLATTEVSWSRFGHCLSNIRWFVPGSDQI